MSGKTLADYESELWEDPRALLDLIADKDQALWGQIEFFVEQEAIDCLWENLDE